MHRAFPSHPLIIFLTPFLSISNVSKL
jgi:hypothetical protein